MLLRLLTIGQVIKPSPLMSETELDVSGRAISVLGQHDFRNTLLGLVFPVVVLGPVNEDDEIGILFDGTRVPQIRENRPALATALLGGAGELGQGDDRNLELPREGLERTRDVRDFLNPVLG